jgi:hypothetical protein
VEGDLHDQHGQEAEGGREERMGSPDSHASDGEGEHKYQNNDESVCQHGCFSYACTTIGSSPGMLWLGVGTKGFSVRKSFLMNRMSISFSFSNHKKANPFSKIPGSAKQKTDLRRSA